MEAELFELNPETRLATKAEVLKTQVIKVPGKKGPLVICEPRKMTQDRFHSAARMYYITNPGETKDVRGGHYHPDKDEILCVQMGSAEFLLKDSEGNEDHFYINSIDVAVFIPAGVWHEITLAPRTLLTVLSPREYRVGEAIEQLP